MITIKKMGFYSVNFKINFAKIVLLGNFLKLFHKMRRNLVNANR